MKGTICEHCASNFLKERPGEFFDFDADMERHGSIGVPLCSWCLGTGKELDSQKFQTLCQEVNSLRKDNFRIQIEMSKKLIKAEEGLSKLKKNNKRLTEIASIGLSLVETPVPNCLAEEIKRGQEP